MPEEPKKKLPSNYYFDNDKVEELIIEYHKTGCTDVALRDKIMENANELIVNVIRTHNLHGIYAGGNEASFNDLFQIAWQQIESTLYKFDAKPGHSKIFNMWCVAPDSQVITEHGVCDMVDLSLLACEQVYTPSGLKTVEAGMIRPEDDCVCISTEHALDTTVGLDHPIFVKTDNKIGFKPAQELQITDKILLQYNQQSFPSNTFLPKYFPIAHLTEDICYLIGLAKGGNGTLDNDSVIINGVYGTAYLHKILQKWHGELKDGVLIIDDPLFIDIYTHYDLQWLNGISRILSLFDKNNAKAFIDGICHCRTNGTNVILTHNQELTRQFYMLSINLGMLWRVKPTYDGYWFSYIDEDNVDIAQNTELSDLGQLNGKFIWTPVVSIKRTKSQLCEISVDSPSRAYIVNGLVSHNSQITRTVILAAIKKDNRDRKNADRYKLHLDHKALRRDIQYERFMKELRELFQYCDEHLNILDALERLHYNDPRPHEGLISKLTDITKLPRARVIRFIRIVRLFAADLSDGPFEDQSERQKIIKPSEVVPDTDEE